MLPRFSSLRVKTREEALNALAGSEPAAIIAGGTDLLVRMKRGEAHSRLVDIASVAELKGIDHEGSRIRIASATTHSRISTDPLLRQTAASLADAAGGIGSPQIRNMGTIGGNLANASPCAESITPLLIHNAVLMVESADGERVQSLQNFITAPYRTTLSRTELLSAIRIEPLVGYREGYRRVAKRAAWAISRLGIAWAIKEDGDRFVDVRLGIGSCTPRPFRPAEAESLLNGRRKEKTIVEEAVRLCLEEIRKIGERPSFVYKLPVIRDLLRQVLLFGHDASV
jgi:CO/xanthine dehydrogenase FAD-binding subunit